MSLHPKTQMGAVALTVSDLARSLRYYQDIIGLKVHRQDGETAVLGTGGEDLLRLRQVTGARASRNKYTGLFHFALLLPTRRDLALILRHLISLNLSRLGASDHWVSEALYLDDPDGHGIEIYADRPRDHWSFSAGGTLQMTTQRMNTDDVLREISAADQWNGLPLGTRMGHVHLRVGNIGRAKAFYVDLLGFDQMVDYAEQASFISAGGYHHHLGMNVWGSLSGAAAPEDMARLDYFTIMVPDDAAQRDVIGRLQQADIAVTEDDGIYYFADPFQTSVALAISAS